MFVDDEALAVPDDTDDLPALAAIKRPRKLAEEASELLRAQILSGNLRRGTHLVEAKLAARLGLSRGPVRDALKILIADGLVREEPRRGAFVISLSRNDVREIYDVRAAIEGRAAFLVARDRQPATLDPLSEAVNDLATAAAAHDMRAMRREDLAFHALICELSGNKRLLEIFNRYVPLVQALLSYDQLVYQSPEASAHEHQSIFDAIYGGDGVAAMREVVEHCERARDKVIVYFEEAPAD
jgi:DNA-binding GntR family transcriptional regulator